MVTANEIEEMSRLFKMVSYPSRVAILFLLKEGPHSVNQLVEGLDMEQSAVSHQLRLLKDARLVKSHREGKSQIYELDDLHVFSILEQSLTHIRER
ncbi:ArsR family transcriptional regulator [Aerococcus urinaehominis]|uniref:ArsR family transcriptional regulator n=1 Tax=Aerococcus urinaehominis TaxID=128944 RepID=A0A0X8FKP8_9LACT|nr:metalloregulator ArsR/SmtB family transcription factor [Aerococcus urinaehominis]AMB99090.1 ArsR family transcriptional regulator [Aerococcus urinaehominis]SDM03294.1 DNA-binding transcriptional regulator, ArsR family [Aerococcus urinaehominis]